MNYENVWGFIKPSSSIRIRNILFEEQEGKCYYCHAEMIERGRGRKARSKPMHDLNPTIDHKIPQTRGGTNDKHNLCAACHKCNTRKASMTEEEYVSWMKRRGEI